MKSDAGGALVTLGLMVLTIVYHAVLVFGEPEVTSFEEAVSWALTVLVLFTGRILLEVFVRADKG